MIACMHVALDLVLVRVLFSISAATTSRLLLAFAAFQHVLEVIQVYTSGLVSQHISLCKDLSICLLHVLADCAPAHIAVPLLAPHMVNWGNAWLHMLTSSRQMAVVSVRAMLEWKALAKGVLGALSTCDRCLPVSASQERILCGQNPVMRKFVGTGVPCVAKQGGRKWLCSGCAHHAWLKMLRRLPHAATTFSKRCVTALSFSTLTWLLPSCKLSTSSFSFVTCTAQAQARQNLWWAAAHQHRLAIVLQQCLRFELGCTCLRGAIHAD